MSSLARISADAGLRPLNAVVRMIVRLSAMKKRGRHPLAGHVRDHQAEPRRLVGQFAEVVEVATDDAGRAVGRAELPARPFRARFRQQAELDLPANGELRHLARQRLVGAAQQLHVMHGDRDLVGERGEGALALLAQPGTRAGRIAQLQRAQILAGGAQRQEDPRVSPLFEALAGRPVRPLVRAAHDPHAALTQAAHRGMAAAQREPRILARLIAAGSTHTCGDPGCPAAVVHQVEERVIAAQRLGGRFEHARHGGLHGARIQHGLAYGPIGRADHDVLQRAARVLQEMQHVGQFARQLVRIPVRHVTLDSHHADGPRAGGQRDDQPRLVRTAA